MVLTMTKWERIRAAIRGEEVDRVPVALWKHFPQVDQTPEGLAQATIAFQKQYDWDVLKFTPAGTYGIEDWGAETVWEPNPAGVRTVVKHGVTDHVQWPMLPPQDATKGYIGNQIKALSLVAKEFREEVPILQTVFSPLTTARKLAGDRVLGDLLLHSIELKAGLEVITETTIQFAIESIKAGAHGIFFATQNASLRSLRLEDYQEFGEAYDLRVLEAIRSKAEFIMLHIHGLDILWDIANRYPIDMVNWHDRLTPPSLQKGKEKFQGMVVGGVDECYTLYVGPISAIQAQVKEAIHQTGGQRFMIGPGCVVPGNIPEEYLCAVREVVEV